MPHRRSNAWCDVLDNAAGSGGIFCALRFREGLGMLTDGTAFHVLRQTKQNARRNW